MKKESFSLILGSLRFDSKALSIIATGLFLLGLIVGIYSIYHIENPNTSIVVMLLFFAAMVIPCRIVVKGIHKAKDLN